MSREINNKNTVILSCSSLITHVNAAQQKMGTGYKIIPLDRRLHAEPLMMRQRIIETMAELPESVDNILVSMGFCGGSWRNVDVKHRVVIPRVDDCITLLLHIDEKQHNNLKKAHHLYFRDGDDKSNTFILMKKNLTAKYGDEEGGKIFNSWFSSYTDLDVINTGVYDCLSGEYTKAAEENAELIGCRLAYVPGSNLILEKLVSGRWDEQFLVIEPGKATEGLDYLDTFANG